MGGKRVCITLLAAVTTAFLTAVPTGALAYDSDAALERDGVLCTRQVSRSERQYGIPQRLLGAIAATETGRRHKGLGIQVPWPWSINVEGKPYLFHSKREAIQAVEQFQSQGYQSIDVGCMQVNLRHHPDAFANLSQAFEPSYNVDYAARFLRGHYDETYSWKEAVGRYHSRTPGYAARYVAAVYGQWYGLASRGPETQRTASRSRYQSYVRLEKSGEQVNLNGSRRPNLRKVVTPATPANEHVIKAAKREKARGYELSIIRPASAAGKIATAPTSGNDSTGPLVMNTHGEQKAFTSSKVVSISANGTANEGQDSRFIRFVD